MKSNQHSCTFLCSLYVTQLYRGEAIQTNWSALLSWSAHNFLIMFVRNTRPSLQTDYVYQFQTKTLTVYHSTSNTQRLNGKFKVCSNGFLIDYN